MRILHLLNDVHHGGNGIVNVAVDLACVQTQAGHQVMVASRGGGHEAILRHYGVTHICIPQQGWAITPLIALLKIWRLVRSFQPEIVHAHMRTGVLLASLLKPFASYRVISTVHNEFQKGAILMGLADRVIAVSGAVRTKLIKRGLSAARLDTVRNGTVGSPRQSAPLSPGKPPVLQHPCIATVAGLFDRKGIRDLLAAFEILALRHPAAHLYLIGGGPQRQDYEAIANASAHRDRIHFEGFQPDVAGYLKQVYVFVLASHVESFGLAIAEARQAGAAVVATDVDGIPEALEGGSRGILVKPRDPAGLAAAIDHLLSHPEELDYWRKRASENTQWLSVERMADETMDVYLRALGRSQPWDSLTGSQARKDPCRNLAPQ